MLSLATRTQYRTLLDAITLQHADDTPALIYVASDADTLTITRATFADQVRQHAAALVQLGITAGDLVLIAHTQSLESIYTFWAAMTLGAIPSMFPTLTEKLDPVIYQRNLAELVERSHVRLILTTDDFAPQLAAAVNCAVHGSLASRLDPAAATPSPVQTTPETIAFLQHSSGTTGLQKGVALSHQAVLNQLASYSDALHLSAQDRIVSWLPLYHDMGLIAGFMLPLMQGVPLILMSPFDWVRHPALLLKAIDAHRATLCWQPNFAYAHNARRIRPRDSEGLSLASMRAFINCSEPVHDASHQQFLTRFAENGVTPQMLAVSYAMAENTFAVTQTPINQPPTVDCIDRLMLQNERRAVPIAPDAATAAPQVSCGRPITGTAVKVLADDGITPLPARHVGEIWVKSDCMLTGYYQREDLQPFDADGWYQTGDRGYLAEGEVYIVGRSKDLIINAGKNVYPQDIEAIINTVEGVHAGRAVVFGVPDATEGTELIAAVAEVDTDDPAVRKSINQQIRQRIGSQTEITLSYVTLVAHGWLIKTSSGKIARGQNREKWLAEFNA